MLQLVNINKYYNVVDQHGKVIPNETIKALDGINLSFGDSGLVSIIGASGSGKSTLLTVLAGLTKPDSGSDMIIDGVSTTRYTQSQWNYHRNISVGMVFQQYHLIEQLSVLDNVTLALDLAGVSGRAQRARAKSLLNRLGLSQHIYKKPNTLSGGQKQRVAIARAIINKPHILLCDEPTGALDSATGRDIMSLLREISRDTLVIMVTHDMALADSYSDRIIELSDGIVVDDKNNMPTVVICDDTHSLDSVRVDNANKLKKQHKPTLGAFTATKIAFRNIITKLSRTLLTSFACAIGITGVGLSLALNSGFSIYSVDIVDQQLATYPIIVKPSLTSVNLEKMHEYYGVTVEGEVSTSGWENYMSNQYYDYIADMPEGLASDIVYDYYTDMVIVTDGFYDKQCSSFTSEGVGMFPVSADSDILDNQYTLVAGEYPTHINQLVLIVDNYNAMSYDYMSRMFPDIIYGSEQQFDEVIGQKFALPTYDDMFVEVADPTGHVLYNEVIDPTALFADSDSMMLEIVGVARRENPSIFGGWLAVGCKQELFDYYHTQINNSQFGRAQLADSQYNVVSGIAFDDTNFAHGMTDSDYQFRHIGLGNRPGNSHVYIYANSDQSRRELVQYLLDYNDDMPAEDRVYPIDSGVYCGTTETILSLGVIVFLGLSALCVVVSAVLIAIIAYTSVLEQKKKIGLLRSIGSSKFDIIRVFSGENVIIGVLCGIIGTVCATLLCPFANDMLLSKFGIANIAVMTPVVALTVVCISVVTNILAGLIPAVMASNQDPIDCLNSVD